MTTDLDQRAEAYLALADDVKFTLSIDRAVVSIIREQQAEIATLKARFTRLDTPKHSGDPMLDHVLTQRNPEFDAWVATLPPTYWARYDLSAARIGWEAQRAEIERLRKALDTLRGAVLAQNRAGASWHPHVFTPMMDGLALASALIGPPAAVKEVSDGSQ